MTADELKAAPPRIQSAILKKLSYREREIIKLRLGIGDGYIYTAEEVGHIFKVGTARIDEIEQEILRKLWAMDIESFYATKATQQNEELNRASGPVESDPDLHLLSLLIDPGTASSEDLAELFFEISKLYRMVGGEGIRFDVSDSRSLSESEAVS